MINWGLYHYSVLRVLLYPAWRIKKDHEKKALPDWEYFKDLSLM